MIGTMNKLIAPSVSTFIYILHLETALLIEPVLQTGNNLVLIHTEVGVEVEEVVTTYKINAITQRDVSRQIGTTACDITVLTFKIFTMYVEVLRLVVKACRPTITLVVGAFLDVRNLSMGDA